MNLQDLAIRFFDKKWRGRKRKGGDESRKGYCNQKGVDNGTLQQSMEIKGGCWFGRLNQNKNKCH